MWKRKGGWERPLIRSTRWRPASGHACFRARRLRSPAARERRSSFRRRPPAVLRLEARSWYVARQKLNGRVMPLSLSVLVPVYNEQYLVAESLQRLKALEQTPHLERIEVIVVDDCSTDDTPRVLDGFRKGLDPQGRIRWTFLRHDRNGGKGKAIKTALEKATCDVTVIHDADLEYHPKDLLRIVQVFMEEDADAVFGSRFAGGDVRRVLNYRHELGNRLLTT